MRTALYAFALMLLTMGSAQAACTGFPYTLTNGQPANADQVMANFDYALRCSNLGIATASKTPTPQGRLTLTSQQPVLQTDRINASTVYYTPYTGNEIPIYDSTAAVTTVYDFAELSVGLDATVPHVAANAVYDVYVTLDAGSPVACIGPAWQSQTERGTGAGTAQLHSGVAHIWTNANDLTNCWGGGSGITDYGPITANEGTYVGTVLATANGQTGMAFNPAAAVGGSGNVLGVWNAYNRVRVTASNSEATGSWSYGAVAWRSRAGSGSGYIRYVDGLGQSSMDSVNTASINSVGGSVFIGIGLNDNTAPYGFVAESTNAPSSTVSAHNSVMPILGVSTIHAMEYGAGGTAPTFTSGGYGSWLAVSLDM